MTETRATADARPTVANLVRDEWGRVLASLVADFGDLQLAEDALQDAMVAALQHWPDGDWPRSPAAWLLTVARRRVLDRLRHDRRHDARRAEFELLAAERATEFGAENDPVIPDERLRLIFTCCHPALRQSAQVALTLRALCGLKTHEIARAFLVAETTMAQRLVRARKKIGAAGIPYRVPDAGQLPDRLHTVLTVIYLIFNEGWSATSGAELVRNDLCHEALHLVAVLDALLPGDAEIEGLHALILLHSARAATRTNATGDIVTLDAQDRRQWDTDLIAAGNRMLQRSDVSPDAAGPYRLQALVSAEHANAPTWDATDWDRINMLYDALRRAAPSPVVSLNAAVARFMGGCNEEAAAMLDDLEASGELAGYLPFYVARAELHRRRGDPAAARRAAERALALSRNDAERRCMALRLKRIDVLLAGPE